MRCLTHHPREPSDWLGPRCRGKLISSGLENISPKLKIRKPTCSACSSPFHSWRIFFLSLTPQTHHPMNHTFSFLRGLLGITSSAFCRSALLTILQRIREGSLKYAAVGFFFLRASFGTGTIEAKEGEVYLV